MAKKILTSRIVRGVSCKGSGDIFSIQTIDDPSDTVFSVNAGSKNVIVSGSLSTTTLQGKKLATSEVLVDVASVIDLDKDITIFANTAAATATLAPGTDGQVKYVSKTTTGAAGKTVTITKSGGGDLVGVGKTSVILTTVGSCATFVYNKAQGFWCLVKIQNSVVG